MTNSETYIFHSLISWFQSVKKFHVQPQEQEDSTHCSSNDKFNGEHFIHFLLWPNDSGFWCLGGGHFDLLGNLQKVFLNSNSSNIHLKSWWNIHINVKFTNCIQFSPQLQSNFQSHACFSKQKQNKSKSSYSTSTLEFKFQLWDIMSAHTRFVMKSMKKGRKIILMPRPAKRTKI